MLLGLALWYSLGIVACVLLEYTDFKRGLSRGFTVRMLVKYLTASFCGGFILVLAVWDCTSIKDKTLFKYKER